MLKKCLVMGFMVIFLSACGNPNEPKKEENKSRNDTSYRQQQDSQPAENF